MSIDYVNSLKVNRLLIKIKVKPKDKICSLISGHISMVRIMKEAFSCIYTPSCKLGRFIVVTNYKCV